MDIKLKDVTASLKKEKYLLEATKSLTVKTFYDKHIKTIFLFKTFTVALSIISIGFGCIAVFATALDVVGLDLTLYESLSSSGVFPYLLLVGSAVFLAFFEIGKHHFYDEGFTEFYRETDDFGTLEFSFAAVLQIISILLSFYGGYLTANELAGTEKTATKISIESDFLPRLLAAKEEKENYFEIKSYRGKLSDKNISQYNVLSNNITTIETDYKTALDRENVGAGFVAATEIGTKKMIAILGGSQIVIEALLFLILWWLTYFKSMVVHEQKHGAGKKVQIYEPQMTQEMDTTYSDTQDTNEPLKKRVRVEGFNRKKSGTLVVPQRTQENTQEMDTQDTSHKSVFIDLTNEKKRVRAYIPRINKTFTESLLKSLQRDIPVLAAGGFRTVIKKDGSVSIKQDKTIASSALIEYTREGLKITYL